MSDGVGTAFMIQNKHEEAGEFSDGSRARSIECQNSSKTGIGIQRLGEVEKVLQSAQIVLQSNPSHHQTINGLCTKMLAISIVVRLYRKAIEIVPNDLIYQSNLLWCILHSEKYSAQKLLKLSKSMVIKPQNISSTASECKPKTPKEKYELLLLVLT